MINYIDPERWIILQYRSGAGGKMLLLCLMTIDKIAHWDPDVENGLIDHSDSLLKYWRDDSMSTWLKTEPVTHWHSEFYSRTFPRGDSIGLEEYNTRMNANKNDYFKLCWSKGKIILDFLHKSQVPSWHQGSTIIKLGTNLDDLLYQKMLLSKLIPWDPITKIGTCCWNNPMINHRSDNVNKFKNQFEFGPFQDSESWLNFVFQNFSNINFKMDNPDILFRDLLDFNKVENFISNTAKNLLSSYDKTALKKTHEYWMSKHKDFVDFDLNNLYNSNKTGHPRP